MLSKVNGMRVLPFVYQVVNAKIEEVGRSRNSLVHGSLISVCALASHRGR